MGTWAASRAELALEGLRCLDRAEQARRVIEAEGLTVCSKRTGIIHTHPMIQVEDRNRAQFTRIWVRLGLAARRYPIVAQGRR